MDDWSASLRSKRSSFLGRRTERARLRVATFALVPIWFEAQTLFVSLPGRRPAPQVFCHWKTQTFLNIGERTQLPHRLQLRGQPCAPVKYFIFSVVRFRTSTVHGMLRVREVGEGPKRQASCLHSTV